MSVQVQSATKDREGKSLSVLNRQFISFSYGGKNIEDFDLLTVFSNDRLDKEIYAPFNDTTTEQAELDGQMFWRTNFKANQLNFDLATDGITSAQLEDFKNWFQPGFERELILTENHNRAIMARVASTPQMSLLPFEKEITVNVGGLLVSTSITLYKGDIKLNFIMDDPYWYSKDSFLNSEIITPEQAKIIIEDGVPHRKMFQTSCFLADNYFCTYSNGQINLSQNHNVTLSPSEENGYRLYYCGTAPEKPEVSFSITPSINSTTGKISFPGGENGIYKLNIGSGDTFQSLEFTVPNTVASYNKALDILEDFPAGKSILDLRSSFRDNLFDYYARSFAIGIVDYAKTNKIKVSASSEILTGFKDFFIQQMAVFLSGDLKFTINGKTGVVTVTGKFRQFTGEKIPSGQEYIPSTSSTITENTGNMLKSNYLNIDTRTLPKNGYIVPEQCLLVTTNTTLSNLKINYKYKYL